jgi:hypothetical protein
MVGFRLRDGQGKAIGERWYRLVVDAGVRTAAPGETGAPAGHPHVSPGDPFAGDPFADEASAPADEDAALQKLLKQVNARWPARSVGRQDGVQVERGRFALAISEDDNHGMPSLRSLAAILARDPRHQKNEVLTPSFWNSVERPYLKVMTWEGPPSADPRPWILTAGVTGDAGYPAQPSLAALKKLEAQLDAVWPDRQRQTGGNVSDAAEERGRGMLVVPESAPGLGPGLAALRAAVDRDPRVVETEIVTPSLLGSRRIVVRTLRIWTAGRGDDAGLWDIAPPSAGFPGGGPGWQK